LIGCGDTSDSSEGVPRLEGPFAVCDGDDDQSFVLGLGSKGELPLATRKGGLDILLRNHLDVVIGPISRLEFHLAAVAVRAVKALHAAILYTA
jgi:hypothetical protein